MIEDIKEVWSGGKRISLVVSSDNKIIHNDPYVTIDVNPNWNASSTDRFLTIKTDTANYINWGFTSGYWAGRLDLYGTTAVKNLNLSQDNNVNLGITQAVSIYNDVEELEISYTGNFSIATPNFRINEVTKKVVLSNFSTINLVKVANNLALEYFEKIGGQNAITSLANLNGLTKLKTLKITNNNQAGLLTGFVNTSLELFYINSGNQISDITMLENSTNLKCLITDPSPQNIDWIARTNIKGYRNSTFGGPSIQSLTLDLKTVLTGKLHFINLDRVLSLSYSGGGIFPSVIHDNEGYFSEAVAIIKLPLTTSNSIANADQVAQLLIDFANQVTAVNIPTDKKKIITGRTPTAAYTDNSQPIYKTYTAAKAYIESLGITISNS